MKVFIWFALNEEERRTMKVTVIAADLGQARRMALHPKMYLPAEARLYVTTNEPSVIVDTPTVQYEASAHGKAASWIRGGEGLEGV